jgi:hypothetical protein
VARVARQVVLIGVLGAIAVVVAACTSSGHDGPGPASGQLMPSARAPSAGRSSSTAGNVSATAGSGSAAFVRQLRAWVAQCRPSCSTPRTAATINDAPTGVVAFCRQHAPAPYANLPLYAYVGYHDQWQLAWLPPMTYTDDVECHWSATLTSEPSAALGVLVPSTGPNPQRFVCGPHLLAGCVTTSGGLEYEQPLDVVPAAGAYGETMRTARWFVGTSELLVVVGVTAKIRASPGATALVRASMSDLLTNMRLPLPRS